MWKSISVLFSLFITLSCLADSKGIYQISEKGVKNAEYLRDSAMFYHFVQKNNKKESASALLKALDKKPDSVTMILFAVGLLKDNTISEEEMLTLVRKHPESSILYAIVAEALRESGKKEISDQLTQEALSFRLDPGEDGSAPRGLKDDVNQKDFQIFLINYLQTQAQEKKFSEADAVLKKVFRYCKMDLAENCMLGLIEYYLRADAALKKESYRAAYKKYAAILQEKLDRPNQFHEEVSIALIKMLVDAGEQELVESLASESLLTRPLDQKSYRNLVSWYGVKKWNNNALRALSNEVILYSAKNRRIPVHRIPLMLFYSIKVDDEKAVQQHISMLERMKKMNDDLYFDTAFYYLGRKNAGKARYYISRIQNSGMKMLLSGYLFQYEKKYKEALNIFLKLERAFPQDLSYKMQAADLAKKTGNKEIETQFINEMILKADQHPEFQNFLGYTWADAGIRLEQAEKYLDSALKADPDNYAYLDSMAWLAYRKKDFVKAKTYILRALEQSKSQFEHGVLLDHAGDIFQALGETAKAREYWQKAVQSEDPELDMDAVMKKLLPGGKLKWNPVVQNQGSKANDPKTAPAAPQKNMP